MSATLFVELPLSPEDAYWHACTGSPVAEPEPRSRYWPDVNAWLAVWDMAFMGKTGDDVFGGQILKDRLR